MLDNYKDSLPRKRIRLKPRKGMSIINKEVSSRKLSESAWRGGAKKKLDISSEELKKLVWEKPIYQIAIEKGVSDATIRKWCKKFEIERPPQGYWIKKKSIKNRNL